MIPAWLAGYSGKGVTISIIDDGLDHKHPELIDRYVSRRIFGFFSVPGEIRNLSFDLIGEGILMYNYILLCA